MLGTYDHTMANISVQGIALTHFNGDVVISKEGDDWDVTEGSNGCVQRSKMVRKLYTVTLPFMQTSPQLSKLEALRVADETTKVGPYPFACTDLNGAYVLLGQCWIQSMGDATKGRSGGTRTVTLRVKAEAAFEGA